MSFSRVVNLAPLLTLEAEELLAAAQDVERPIADLERRIAGHELRLEGEIRVATTDALFMSTVAPHLATFNQKYPDITVEVALTNHRLSFTRREADVAISPMEGSPDQLVGKRLAELEFGLYATPDYLKGKRNLPFSNHRSWH